MSRAGTETRSISRTLALVQLQIGRALPCKLGGGGVLLTNRSRVKTGESSSTSPPPPTWAQKLKHKTRSTPRNLQDAALVRVAEVVSVISGR